MAGLPLTALALCLFIPAEHSRINVTDGGNALFSVRPSAEVVSGSWAFGGKTVVQWIGESVVYGSGYQSRAEVFTSNGSLRLRSVNMSDSGEYHVTMFPKSGSQASATISLRVFEAVSDVTVSTNDSTPVENVDAIALTCHAFGTVQTRTWLKNNRRMQENGRIFTSPDNSELTITSVNRNDAGTYKCIVSNSLSSGAGETYVQVYSLLTDACCTLCPGAIAGIVLGLLGVGLISGMCGWLIGRKTGGVKGPPQAKYGKSFTSGAKSTLATNTANTVQTYENFPRNEQNISTNAPVGNSTYMGLKLEDRSVYSDLKR